MILTNFKLTFSHQPLEDFGRLRLPSPSPAATQVLNCSFREPRLSGQVRWFLGVSLEILVSPLESLPVWRGLLQPQW